MGRGASKSGGGGAANKPANTPSGMTYEQFLAMPEDQRFDALKDIVENPNIVVPDYLDKSVTSKVMYALGMNNKPTVVDDATLDTMPGRDIYRTVYELPGMPPPSSDAIIDQIRTGDYTQLSGKGGSAHGRALYFATDYYDSAVYGHGEKNAQVMRSKINPNAKMVSESNLRNQMQTKSVNPKFNNLANHPRVDSRDRQSLYAISQGIDGWYSGTYSMIVNRGILTASSQAKTIRAGRGYARSWATANNVK